jgi:hypothetical protein
VTVSGTAIGAGCGAGSGADTGRIDSGDGRGAAGLTGIGVTLTGLLRVGFGLRCIKEFKITATIPAKQSSSTEMNRPGTLNCPLPRDSGDWASVPMILAMEGRIRLLVTETISPQMPSPRTTAIRRRPIHLPASGGDVFAVSSI